MLKISYACCLGLSLVILAQFTLEICITVLNRKNSPKPAMFGVQGHSRSSMSAPMESSPALLVKSCHDMQKVCVYLQPFSH